MAVAHTLLVPGGGYVVANVTAGALVPGVGYVNLIDPGFQLLSLDGDNTVAHGQSAIILPAAGVEFAASGNRVEIVQDTTTVTQAVTAESTASITVTVNLTGLTVPGSGTLRVGKPQ